MYNNRGNIIRHLSLILIIFTNTGICAPNRQLQNDATEDESAITTRVIDLNNPEHESYLRQFNISAEQLKFIRATTQTAADEPEQQEEDRRLSDIKELRFQDIRNKIENAVHGNSMMNYNNLPTHEMAAFPTCTQINESTWQQENNITIRFAASLFANERPHMYLDTAVLRLYKLNPHPEVRSTESPYNCDENLSDSQIRVTVSTMQYLKRNKRGEHREKKKRICNTVMLNVSQTGWVEMDIKKAINIWEKAERQGQFNTSNNNRLSVKVGWLTIEVHDDEERPLRAGLYFEPPKCSQAYPAVPWNFYRQYYAWPAAGVEKVPRSPRLDIKWVDYRGVASYRPHAHSSHHNHNKNTYRHSSNPHVALQTTPSDNLSSSEVRTHRRRHEQGHNCHHHHHHHHHTDKSEDSSNENSNTED